MKVALTLLVGTFLIPTLPAQSHHSFLTQYDLEVIITVSGVVTEVWYQNPHTRVYVEVENDQGAPALWEMETYPRNILVRRGWKHSDLGVGDEVVVTGRQARDGGNRLQILTINRPSDGWIGVGFDEDSVD